MNEQPSGPVPDRVAFCQLGADEANAARRQEEIRARSDEAAARLEEVKARTHRGKLPRGCAKMVRTELERGGKRPSPPPSYTEGRAPARSR